MFVVLATPTVAKATSERRLQTVSPDAKPSFALPALDGATHDLQQQAGRVVLVHFFATWCEPCRDELASLRTLVQSQGATLSVLAVNVGDVPGRVRRFLEGSAVNFPVLLDSDRAVTKAWAVHALPTTYILDRSLVPRLVVEGDLDWSKDETIAALRRAAGDFTNTDLKRLNREDSK